MDEVKALLEALLFAAMRPVSLDNLSELVGLTEEELQHQLDELSRSYRDRGAGVELVRVAGGYQLRTRKEFAEHVERMLAPEPRTLSQAALEVLAIVACKQPVTRAEIEAVRGVSSDSSLKTLLECGLVEELGRKDSPGRPFLYGTTQRFLEEFGLNSLEDLNGQVTLPRLTQEEDSQPAG